MNAVPTNFRHDKFKFARKVLRKDTTEALKRLIIERDNLRIFTDQRHENIVRALFFYEWKEHMNFVFPFMEGDLSKLLSGKWDPPERNILNCEKGPRHWLWAQMVGVADGLQTIHNPQSPIFKDDGSRGVGFHFDLKPANVLVSDDGKLKITDFGLSMIKRVRPSSGSYGIFRGGAPRYSPPEVSPTVTVDTGRKPDELKNKYDVWSFACIALEIIIYILSTTKADGVQSPDGFQYDLDLEEGFHGSRKIKDCVTRAMDYICSPEVTDTKEDRFKDWALHTVELLWRMFDFQPQSRPSSREVAEKLRDYQEEYMSGPEDTLKQALKEFQLTNHPRIHHEARWPKGESDVSFVEMLVLSYLFRFEMELTRLC